MKEFLGIGGYTRPAEGYMSFEHLFFVSSLMALTIALAIFLGLRYKKSTAKKKNLPLIYAAIITNVVEISKVIIVCIRSSDPWAWLYFLPLFLCSIQFITIPLAAFSHGRLKEAAIDFVFIFGLLGAVMGTYFAGNNYSVYPVLSLDNVSSGITHCISGFASLYICVSGCCSMKRRNMLISFSILLGFAVAALVTNLLMDYNYMFLMRGDGTPYDILYNLVGGNAVLYAAGVVILFLLYISAFYGVYFLIEKKRAANAVAEDVRDEAIVN